MSNKPKWTTGPQDDAYLYLQDDDIHNMRPCGCQLHTDNSSAAVYLCQLHAAAPLMAEALERIATEEFDDLDPDDCLHTKSARALARAAIAAAKGERP